MDTGFGRQILIIEDENDVADLLEMGLRKAGFKTNTAGHRCPVIYVHSESAKGKDKETGKRPAHSKQGLDNLGVPLQCKTREQGKRQFCVRFDSGRNARQMGCRHHGQLLAG